MGENVSPHLSHFQRDFLTDCRSVSLSGTENGWPVVLQGLPGGIRIGEGMEGGPYKKSLIPSGCQFVPRLICVFAGAFFRKNNGYLLVIDMIPENGQHIPDPFF
jgi:hypothetical protein